MVKEVLQLLWVAVVGIVSRCGLIIEVRPRNQPNKTMLALYRQLFSHRWFWFISDVTLLKAVLPLRS